MTKQLVAFFMVVVVLTACTGSMPPRPSPNESQRSTHAAVARSTPSPESSPRRLGPQLSSVEFLDAEHGWVAGYGFIAATADGGRTWTRQYQGDVAIEYLDVLDRTHAWAVGSRRLLRTEDGGAHWTAAPKPPGIFQPSLGAAPVDFVTPILGWAVTLGIRSRVDGRLFETTDGGRTWRRMEAAIPPQSVCFSDTEHGWIGGEGRVDETTNGGHSWRPSFHLTVRASPAGWKANIRCLEKSAWALFTDGAAAGSEGYAAVQWTLSGWKLRLGGLLRGTIPRIDAYAGPFDALSDGEAFFLGACSPCDSGTTSMTKASTGSTRVEHIAVPKPKRQSPEGLSPVAISFVSPERGWVVVQFERWKANEFGDLLLDTSNGGRTWKRAAIVS